MEFPDLPEPVQKFESSPRTVRHDLSRAAKEAVKTLVSGMRGDASVVQIRSACAVLDRAGYGPHASVSVDDRRDLSHLSGDELSERAERVRVAIERMMTGDHDNDPSVH